MRFGSVCSGIDAASVAWSPLGWKAAFFSEIEKFPCAVLKHHYPNVPNYGDMTKFAEWPDEPIDLLVGGTPCQSFSVAGLRKGLDDPRGNLMLTFGAIAAKYRPTWLVWENVPGVLSSNGGRDFGTFLGMLAELGYGFAYRVLDAQYFGVAQRRRRVFVVGCLGDWRRAAAVLFERHSLSGNPAPSRKAREGVAASLRTRAPASGGQGTDWQHTVAHTLAARSGAALCAPDIQTYLPIVEKSVAGCLNSVGGHAVPGNSIQDADQGYLIPTFSIQGNLIGRDSGGPQGVGASDGGVMYTLTKADVHGVAQPMAFQQNTRDEVRFISGDGQIAGALAAESGMKQTNYIAQPAPAIGAFANAISFHNRQDPDVSGDVTHPIGAKDNGMGVQTAMQVRRLTPRECERLQGFPDDYTLIPWRGKEAPDGPRYKALGNSMAVPVMAWIGERIDKVSAIKCSM